MTAIRDYQELYLWCFSSAFVLFFAAAPSLIFSFVRMQNEDAHRELTYWKKVSLGMLGGIVGGITAFAVFFPAQSAWCRAEEANGSYCRDGAMILFALTVPLSVVLGSIISLLWTWFSLLIPADCLYASVFSYCGDGRKLNAGIALAVQAFYWSSFAIALYRFTLSEL